MTPLEAIRAKCLDCSCGVSSEVKRCPVGDCPLYAFRFGRKPKIERKHSQEQIESLTARLRSKKT